MGGATSASLPDQLDAEACSRVCGDQFKQEVFDELKGEDGLVDKVAFIRYVQLRNSSSLSNNTAHVRERAIKDIFKAYAYPTTDLSSNRFLQLMRDLRWMNGKFPSTQASAIYGKYNGVDNLVAYDTFRNPVLSDVAAAKEWDMSKLLTRLARHDSAIMAAYVSRKFTEKGHMDRISEIEPEPAPLVERSQSGVPDVRQEAAIKLQSLVRQRSSSKVLNDKKNVKSIAPDCDIFIVIDPRGKEDGWEDQLFDLYKSVCKPHGSMMFGHFKTLITCLGLKDLSFTNRDAEIVFQTIIALASHPNAGTYRHGVTFGKAIDYHIFREIGLPVLADRKGMRLEALKIIISENVGSIDMHIFSMRSSDSFASRDKEDCVADANEIIVG